MPELYELTAAEIVQAVRGGAVSRREVLEAHLDRIDRTNGPVNAIVERRDRERACAEADRADREGAERGALPLDGVPVSIKDSHDVAGMKHTQGVSAMADRVSPADARTVQRLRAAGALIVGKSNLPDFQCRWNTVSSLYGATRNPRDLSRSAGGSSGGDAAAVAAGMAAIGLGGDYFGSLRVPAAFCGIWALRPSAGRVPHVPAMPPLQGPPTLDLMASNGPLARSPEDLWTAYRVLSGPDAADPTTVPAPIGDAPGDQSGVTPPVMRMATETGAVVEASVERELDRVCRLLEDAGYAVEAGGFPGARRAPEVAAELVGAEMLRFSMPRWRAAAIGAGGRDHAEKTFGLFDLGDSLSRYIASFVERGELARSTAVWMESHPLVVAPIAGMVAPPLDFDEFLSVEASRELFDRMRNVPWVNLLSLPSVALPNGIQIVARRFHEHEALAAAAAVADGLGRVPVAEPREHVIT